MSDDDIAEMLAQADEPGFLEALEAPPRKDFRRVGKGIPLVSHPTSGKRTRYRRSSSSGNILDDDYNLWDWKLRTVAVGAAQRPELMALVSTLDADADKRAIRDIAEQCLEAGRGDQRKIQGTAVHSMFDHVDLQHDWVPAPQYQGIVDAYVKLCAYYGLLPTDVEVQCVNDAHRLAGTLDRRYRTTRQLVAPDGTIIPIGSYVVADTKTGTTLEYASGSYATQLAAYVDSVRYDVETDERIPFDPPNYPDWALIIHAVPEQAICEAYWVDVQAGRQGLQLADLVREWRQRTDLLSPAAPPLRAVPAQEPESPAEAATEPQEPRTVLAEGDPSQQSTGSPQGAPEPELDPQGNSQAFTHSTPQGSDEMVGAVKEWLRERVRIIIAHSDLAAKQLQRQWPAGVPGLKADGHTMEMLDDLCEVVDRVETDHSLPFGATDPRTVNAQRRHPSWSDRWAKPRSDHVPDPEHQAAVEDGLRNHPRRMLLASWSHKALTNIDHTISDRTALAHALYEFASVGPEGEWSDDDLTHMLDGTLNALGYEGLHNLGKVKAEDAPQIMSAAFAITSGNCMLLYDDNNRPVVRFNIRTTDMQKERDK